MVKAHRLLNIDRGDYPRLGVLAPIFAMTAACTVILASLSKALFLSQNPISLLPWMFLGAAAITAGTSLGYVALMRALPLAARFQLLLGVAVVSLLALRAAFPFAPALSGVVILLWCPAVGHLCVVQTWNVASVLLPMRQGKRLLPVLAAVSTIGAALGGGLVQLLLRWMGAEDLLVVAALAFTYPLVRVRGVVLGLGGEVGPHKTESTAASVSGEQEGSEIAAGFRSILRRPLLAELALLSFLLQAASLVVDYQFSAELKPQLDKDGIAAFLGTFYWTSNLVVLALTLLVTSRFVRLVGIGVALAASSVVIGVGSAVYFVASTTGAATFWVIAATAFAERVAAYAFTKPAVQMVYMPLQTSGGERAKTIIDGVVYRLATAAVSILLLLAAPELTSQFRLSPPAVIACAVVLYLGLRVRPHYRHALFEALRARRLDADVARYLRDGLGQRAIRDLEARLDSDSADQVLSALEVAHELNVPIPAARIDRLAEHDDERVARAALEAMEALGRAPSAALFLRMLAAHRPPKTLRALLVALSDRASDELAEIVRPLTDHPDASVASAACVFRIRAAGAVTSFSAELEGNSARSGRVRFTGMTRAGDFARELPELIRHDNSGVRNEAIEQMGELGLPLFIPPLLACLDRWDARALSAKALVRFGDDALATYREHLRSDDLCLAGRVALLKVVERIGSEEAARLLVETCASGAATLRDHAVEALWRTAAEAGTRPEDGVLRELAAAEVERLSTLSAVELCLAKRHRKVGPRLAMFAAEVTAQELQSERRVFRLMGLLYDRDALQRAYLHYRSREARARSNAIELLEQHIADEPLRGFVPLIERQEDARGNLRPRSMVLGAAAARGDIDSLVRGEPWLSRLWAWVERDDEAAELDWDEPLDRLVQIKALPMFARSSGEALLEMTTALSRRRVAAGEEIFACGSRGREIYWVLEGEVRVAPPDGRRLTLGRHDCFGEMEALDGLARCASVVATEDTLLARSELEHFEDALELSPHLMRTLIEVLSRRLRAAIA